MVSTADLSTGLPDLAAWDPIAGRLTGTVDSATPETMILPLRSGRIVVMAVPRPLPLDTVTNDLGQRVVWPGCDQARAGWASHIIVGSLHEVSDLAHARDTAEDVVRVAQALVYAIPVEAVSWDGSGLFVQATDFMRMAETSPHPPELLIRCQWWPTEASVPNALTVGTRGLCFFGLPELHDVTHDPDANAVRSRLLNLCSFLIANGPIIRDGATIGVDDNRGIQIRHGADANSRPVLFVQTYKK